MNCDQDLKMESELGLYSIKFYSSELICLGTKN